MALFRLKKDTQKNDEAKKTTKGVGLSGVRDVDKELEKTEKKSEKIKEKSQEKSKEKNAKKKEYVNFVKNQTNSQENHLLIIVPP